jgi:uncharacterized protein
MQIEVLRLAPGEDLRPVLEAFAQNVDAACVLCAVGSFTRAVLRFAAREQGDTIDGPLELVALSGTLGRGGVHLHASVSDAHGQVKGGHLMPRCIVRTTAEVVIALLPGWRFDREADAATGYKELVARRT